MQPALFIKEFSCGIPSEDFAVYEMLPFDLAVAAIPSLDPDMENMPMGVRISSEQFVDSIQSAKLVRKTTLGEIWEVGGFKKKWSRAVGAYKLELEFGVS